MSIKLNLQEVLGYWQWFATFESLNQEALICNQVNLQNDKLEEIDSSSSKEALISPFSFKLNDKTIRPVWLPIYVESDGTLMPSKKLPLPYIPACYCDPLSSFGQVLNKREMIDVVLADFLNEQGKLICDLSWQDYLAKAQDLFKALSPDAFQQWQAQESLTEMYEPPQKDFKVSGLSQQLFELNDEDIKSSNHSASLGEFITPLSAEKLTQNIIDTSLSLLSLKPGSIQTIRAPKASRQEDVLLTLLWSLSAKSIQQEEPICITIVSNDQKQELCTIDESQWLERVQDLLDESVSTKDQALDALRAKWHTLWAYMDKASKVLYQSHDDLPEQIQAAQIKLKDLQERDERLEQEVDKLHQVYGEWGVVSKVTWLGRLMRFLSGFDKNTFYAEFLAKHGVTLDWTEGKSIEETLMTRIRRIKVERAKLNRKQTTLTSKMAEREGLLGANDKILEDYPELQKLEPSERIPFLLHQQAEVRFKIAQLLLNTAQCQITYLHHDELKGYQPKARADWTIIQDAQALKPMDALELLNESQRAVLMGDPMLQQSLEVSENIDAIMLQHLGIIDCPEDLDDLQYAGHLLSQSSLYTMAQPHDSIVQTDPTGLVQVQALQLKEIECSAMMGTYYQGKMPQVKIIEKAKEGLQFVSCGSFDAQRWENKEQAEAILKQVQDHPKERTCIITLSCAQKALMKEMLAQYDLDLSVFSLQEAHQAYDHVLFSTVYDHRVQRPHYLDCGEYPIYKVISLAKCSLTIYGDEKLLNRNTHSPMGALAKCLPLPSTKQSSESIEALID